MPTPDAVGLPELLWDQGWCLRYGFTFLFSKLLAPTGVNPANWVVYNNQNTVMIEEISVNTDTAMTLTVSYGSGDPGLTAASRFDRMLAGGGIGPTVEAQVTAKPAGLTDVLSLPIPANSPTLLLNNHWLALTRLNAMVVYTPAVAGNVTVSIFGRSIS